MDHQRLFKDLFTAKNEGEVDQLVTLYADEFAPSNWYPLGGNESNYGVVENQQSSPVAALVEKLTNSIDAILMRKCLEAGIDPKTVSAPRSIDQAVERFFPKHRDWDLSEPRNQQAESIQIIGDSQAGETADTSIIIYDDGEGQEPKDFEDTFLSLLRGNKNEIHFVQGKYNMGGSGAIAFCGKKRYQLIASKRFNGGGLLGFTLVRRHPLSAQEQQTKKNTWYEYLKLDGKIPAFPAQQELELGLFRRRFRSGTIIKLYSYEVKGNRHVRRDLSRSLNEFLYAPALPIYAVETKQRYPNDKVLQGVVFGLKRQLGENNEYIERVFSEEYQDRRLGTMRVTVHVFRARAKGKDAKDTRKTIQEEYFKNGMAVMFSVHGQVHGHYSSEFITRTLKYNLLRDHLLIHVDCTGMNIEFRNELFMASRDRLKQGEEAAYLRKRLAENLMQGELAEVYKRRKAAISVEDSEDDSLLQEFAENLPINSDLRQLLSQTFKLKETEAKPKKASSDSPEPKPKQTLAPFNPKRYPTFFKTDTKSQNGRTVVDIPLGGSKTLRFDSDVENQYFDRAEDPGDLKIAILDYVPNNARGGNRKGTANQISDVFSVSRKSPVDGTIKVVLSPTDDVQVGDEIRIRVDLTNPAGSDFTQIVYARLTEPPPSPKEKTEPEPEKVGLPNLVRVYQMPPDTLDHKSAKTWIELEEFAIGIETVMYPFVEGDKLETIYVNMDSSVLRSYRAKLKNPSAEQLQLAERRYVTAVYFHTIFLYVISKNRNYRILQGANENDEKDVDMADYLKDLFSSHYASFLMNFEMGALMEGLG